MNLERVHRIIDLVLSSSPPFPPTDVFSEGWMLRLVLDWFSSHNLPGHDLTFQSEATWFSEALLPSPFSYRFRGDSRAEGRTHADGVVGHVLVGDLGKADIALREKASQFVVAEAKMFSPLSPGTKNAPTYNQAARNVACIANVLFRARQVPANFRSLAFLVLAPHAHIRDSGIQPLLAKEAIEAAVRVRASSFAPDLDPWLEEWFIPTVRSTTIAAISWEQVLADIKKADTEAAATLADFYELCLVHNQKPEREAPA
jgi:hypothetical protein